MHGIQMIISFISVHIHGANGDNHRNKTVWEYW